ncbi:hypothetical protein [Salipiger bermudensis]|uniref:hypothetical protein n=1 Tax=Salipiger bermudensis TaxID=344736 RepID=UPI001CD4C221|nr:hypothetical protein [Salipiger bermudensis]MCA0963282.1 hypothetical protein [Salipiger bermudensis]
MTDLDALVEYVAEAVRGWPAGKIEALRIELVAALDDGIQVYAERQAFECMAGPSLFAVLNRHGLNPVC